MAKTHCNHGHRLSGDNLVIYHTRDGRPKRECRICRNESVRQCRQRQKREEPKGELTWANAEAADGPKVAGWILENMPEINYVTDEAGSKRVKDWGKGARADVWALDRLLTRHFMHLSDLPDDVWVPGYARVASQGNLTGGGRKRTKIATKPCETCGEEIPTVKPGGSTVSPAEYRKKRYCSRKCQSEGMRAKLEPKACEACGEEVPMVRESGTRIQPHHYRALRFCSCQCAQDVRMAA